MAYFLGCAIYFIYEEKESTFICQESLCGSISINQTMGAEVGIILQQNFNDLLLNI